jgi:ABC-2 type transport system ATP-binding protein
MGVKISVQSIAKSYGQTRAVDGLSFEVNQGDIFGMLGPNGAGKTTTIECVVGLRYPDCGSVSICGLDALAHPRQVKERIGVQLQATSLPDRIKVLEALRLFASFYPAQADPQLLLHRFSLSEKANDRFETLSGGQKQRLAIALALVHEPEILFLDEPTASLDPQSRRELHDTVRQLREQGKTIFLTTHYIEEAEQLCDRIVIVDHGRVIASGTPRELVANSKSLPTIHFSTTRPSELLALRKLDGVAHVDNRPDGFALSSTNVGQTLVSLVQYLGREVNELLDLHIHKPTLEDVFIELTGRSLRD